MTFSARTRGVSQKQFVGVGSVEALPLSPGLHPCMNERAEDSAAQTAPDADAAAASACAHVAAVLHDHISPSGVRLIPHVHNGVWTFSASEGHTPSECRGGWAAFLARPDQGAKLRKTSDFGGPRSLTPAQRAAHAPHAARAERERAATAARSSPVGDTYDDSAAANSLRAAPQFRSLVNESSESWAATIAHARAHSPAHAIARGNAEKAAAAGERLRADRATAAARLRQRTPRAAAAEAAAPDSTGPSNGVQADALRCPQLPQDREPVLDGEDLVWQDREALRPTAVNLLDKAANSGLFVRGPDFVIDWLIDQLACHEGDVAAVYLRLVIVLVGCDPALKGTPAVKAINEAYFQRQWKSDGAVRGVANLP